MESAQAQKVEESAKTAHAASEATLHPDAKTDSGTAMGMPMFLQRSVATTSALLQRQANLGVDDEVPEKANVEEVTPAEEIQAQSISPVTPPLVQRKCDACEEEKEEEKETATLQPQLKVGKPGDVYEKEADAVADRVVSVQSAGKKSTPTVQTKPATANLSIQTKTSFPNIPNLEEAPGGQASEGETSESEALTEKNSEDAEASAGSTGKDERVQLPSLAPPISEEDVPPIQARASGDSTPKGVKAVQRNLPRTKGGGSPLGANVQSEMEQHFGRDLSAVRIHTDDTSVQMNQSLNAKAFTQGQDIYFNSGEYHPEATSGKHLLAHELTHTVQQGAVSGVVQRFVAPEQTTETEPIPAKPNDGGEVAGRMNEKINNDDNVKNQDELDEEARKAAKSPNRGEVRQESGEISASGEAKPSVDRGAIAQEKTAAQKEQITQKVEEQSEEATEEGEGEGDSGAAPEQDAAEAAAQRAQAAEQRANSVQIPDQPQAFNHPQIDAPVDSAGEPLPRNSQIDTQVRGLGYIGEMLREKGYEMKRHAAEQEIGAHGLEAVLEQQREDLANAETGTETIIAHNEARQEIAAQSHEVHAESIERQQFVAGKAPELASKADEGRTDSSELAGEARGKADQSQSKIPDDPDARADAERQSSDMQDSASGAESMDQAIQQTGERARQYQQDAEAAAEQNQQSQTQITETEELITQTAERASEMETQNAASQAQIDNAGPGPALIRRHSRKTAESGDQLIAATIVMEAELNALQAQYLADMKGIESKESAIRRQQEEQQSSQQNQMSPEEQQLFELAGMSEAEQTQRVAAMEQPERDRLLQTLNRMITEAPDQGTNETEGARLRVDTGLSKAIMGDQPADPRAQEIQQVENRRIQRVGGVMNVADQNMNFLTQEQQQMLANRLVAESVTDDIANINILQMGKQMVLAMIDPRQSLTGIIGGFEKTLSGIANIGNWDAWQRDPLGNLLQIAADISTGLAMVFSTILGIAGIITALMVALTILSWGTLSPVTGPVIGWMGTIMTYAGWGAIISGGLSVYFNYLAYIKNLHDAGTAETARELFGNTEQMKQNASDGFQGAMAVVEGIGAVKMGPKLSSGEVFSNVPRSPGQWARQTAQGVREGASAVAGAPRRMVQGARRLLSGGRQGLVRFKERIQRLFSRRRPGEVDIDLGSTTPRSSRSSSQVDAPQSAPSSSPRATSQSDLPDRTPVRSARDGNLGNFDGQRVRAEVDLPGNQRMRVLEDGRCVVCASPCRYVNQNYARELADQPQLRQRLENIESGLARNPNNQRLLQQHRDIQVRLRNARTRRPARLRQEFADELATNPRLASQLDDLEPRIQSRPENRRNQRRIDSVERELQQIRQDRVTARQMRDVLDESTNPQMRAARSSFLNRGQHRRARRAAWERYQRKYPDPATRPIKSQSAYFRNYDQLQWNRFKGGHAEDLFKRSRGGNSQRRQTGQWPSGQQFTRYVDNQNGLFIRELKSGPVRNTPFTQRQITKDLFLARQGGYRPVWILLQGGDSRVIARMQRLGFRVIIP